MGLMFIFVMLVSSVLRSDASSVQQHRLIVRLEEDDAQQPDMNCTLFTELENVLTATSQQLHNATKGRLQWDRVTIHLSHSQHRDNQCFDRLVKKRSDESADILIHSGGLFGDWPMAQQYGGCGQQGLGVHLNHQFIRRFHSDPFISSRRLLREWVKHRYGVFDERGFEGDAQYPIWTSEYGSHPPGGHYRQNSCNSNTTDTVEEEVEPQEEERNGTIFDTESWSTKKVKAASPPKSSMMASLDAEDWCDGSSHIRWMPTKQNVLCQEQSIWQVMESHPDFYNQPNVIESESTTLEPNEISHQFFPPEFEYVLPPSNGNRYILVLDRSDARRWSLIRRALYRWIHALPASDSEVETYLSLVVSGDGPILMGWTRLTAENRDGLVGRIPRRPLAILPQSSQLLDAAIRQAHQMLVDEKETTCCGGQLVLITGSSVRLPTDLLDDVTVHAVAFPSHSAFIDGRHGVVLAVDEELEDSSLTQARLSAALLQILRNNQRPQTAPTQVYEETVTSADDDSTTGTFHLDAPLGKNVRLVAHCHDEGDLDTMQLVSPSGRVYDLPLVADGMLHIRIPETQEFGEWNYRLKFAATHPSSRVTATVEVTAQPLPSSTQEPIVVRAWTSVTKAVNASSTPILIYAEVRSGFVPVIDAQVIALVRPPGNATRPFAIQLHDRGTGDPDVTRADGIYSAYFTKAVHQAGHYSITVQVTDNSRRASLPLAVKTPVECCGSVMPYEESRPVAQPFRRIVTGPSFLTLDGPEEDEDVYPPGRISDLRVERLVNSSNEVELGWTAPGTDYDVGSAAFYQIRCYTDRSALDDSGSAILVHASLTPQPLPAGNWQKALVAVPWPNQIFYYAIVAVDFAGLTGKVSNIVPVYIDEPPPPPTTTTQPPPPVHNNSTRPQAAVQHLTEQQLYAIAGGVAGFVLLLVVLSIAACLSRRKRGQDEAEEMKPKSTIQVEPLKISGEEGPKEIMSSNESRPVYKIYVNNAYIQEEDGELKIVTPDGRIIQRGSPWFSSATLPRGRSLTHLEGLEAGTSATDLHHWSLPRAKTSPHRHKVLTNGSIMPSTSQSVINTASAPIDGTSISSKPSVSSDDTGIEVSDHQTDSRDSAEMILPPPGFGPIQQHHNGYLPMYGNNLLPPLPPSPGMSQQDARVVRIPSFLQDNNSSGSWLGDFGDGHFGGAGQPSSRRPLVIGGSYQNSETDRTPQISPPPPSTPTSQSSVQHQPRRKTRHISFV